MKIIENKAGNAVRPADLVGRRFRCACCESLYEIESADEVRPGELPCVLVVTCPACGGADPVVGQGGRVYDIPVFPAVGKEGAA